MPGAIVVAGLFVALAVFWSGGGLLSGGTDKTGDTTAEAGVLTPVEVAKAIGLKANDFAKCMDEGRYAEAVNADSQDAATAGATGTPFSVVINAEGARYPIFGAFPIDQVKEIINGAVANDQELLTSLEEQLGAPVGELAPISASDHVNGDINAPVKLVTYSDMECPFCKQFHATAKQVLADYNGQVVLVYRHLPLDFHASAKPLAEGSECAAELGGNDAFWAYLDEVFGV